MKCQQLASAIEEIQPDAGPTDVARLCLLLGNSVEDFNELKDSQTLADKWRDVSLLLQAATDQHAAMTMELEELASGDPQQFQPDQIWVLIRAIKVQSQVLQLYLGQTLDV